MSPACSTSSEIDFSNLPYHELLGLDFNTLTDDQIREMMKLTQDHAANPGSRRAAINRDADKLAGRTRGKVVRVSADDMI